VLRNIREQKYRMWNRIYVCHHITSSYLSYRRSTVVGRTVIGQNQKLII